VPALFVESEEDDDDCANVDDDAPDEEEDDDETDDKEIGLSVDWILVFFTALSVDEDEDELSLGLVRVFFTLPELGEFLPFLAIMPNTRAPNESKGSLVVNESVFSSILSFLPISKLKPMD